MAALEHERVARGSQPRLPTLVQLKFASSKRKSLPHCSTKKTVFTFCSCEFLFSSRCRSPAIDSSSPTLPRQQSSINWYWSRGSLSLCSSLPGEHSKVMALARRRALPRRVLPCYAITAAPSPDDRAPGMPGHTSSSESSRRHTRTSRGRCSPELTTRSRCWR